MRVLVVNAGSSSLKLRLLADDNQLLDSVDFGQWSGPADSAGIAAFIEGAGRIDAVGHRVVHGGAEFRMPVLIDTRTRAAIEALRELAPLHQPRALAGIDAVTEVLPDRPSVACFDTMFHATLPEAAAIYPIPTEWTTRWRIRRYGFHGLSHAYASRRAAELLGRPSTECRVVTCHLGAGASLAAVDGGRSVDTTMGFTPLEGLVMATRSGSIDPGVLLMASQRLGTDAVYQALEHKSGLSGFVGGTGDMRDVLDMADAGDEQATLAFDVYTHRLRREIAAMVAALGGLDALVFTGGVGEHQPRVRSAAVAGLGFLGVALDERDNHQATGDADISSADAAARTLVVEAREDLEIADLTRATLRG
jgi:acetate kinase